MRHRCKMLGLNGGLFWALFFMTACASVPEVGRGVERRKDALAREVLGLGGVVAASEAEKLAAAAVEGALALAHQYRAVRPPWLHNVLVNNGFKERGLCYEWTNDLFAQLYRLRLRTLELHLAVARMDTRWEHNAIMVTAKGAPFESGLILDAWRSSGRLWFGKGATDKYPWVPLPEERVNEELQKSMRGP